MPTAKALRQSVRRTYSQIANRSLRRALFPTGRALAVDVGYPEQLLDALPQEGVLAFCGVSNISMWSSLSAGATVLDLGCGAGMDTVIAAGRVGPAGQVIGVDFSADMVTVARQTLSDANIGYAQIHQAPADRLPLKSATVDTVMMNGLLNLNANRAQILTELRRAIKLGGTLNLSELVLTGPLPLDQQQSAQAWHA